MRKYPKPKSWSPISQKSLARNQFSEPRKSRKLISRKTNNLKIRKNNNGQKTKQKKGCHPAPKYREIGSSQVHLFARATHHTTLPPYLKHLDHLYAKNFGHFPDFLGRHDEWISIIGISPKIPTIWDLTSQEIELRDFCFEIMVGYHAEYGTFTT